MPDDTLFNQPKNTSVFPLAREISSYRQAKLAGRKFGGPIINAIPYWYDTTPIPTVDQTNQPGLAKSQQQSGPDNQTQITTFAKPTSESVKLGEQSELVDEIKALKTKLQDKEKELQEVAQLSEQQKRQLQDLTNREKTNQAIVKNLNQQIMNEEKQPNPSNQSDLDKLRAELSAKVNENKQLKSEIESLKNTLRQEETLKSEIQRYQQTIHELTTQQQKLRDLVTQEEKKLKELEEKLSQKAQASDEDRQQLRKMEQLLEEAAQTSIPKPKPANIKVIPASETKATGQLAPLTKQPNAINGYVKDETGKLIPNAVVIIKDRTHRNLRALKTNQLGQFVVTTSLPNGQYFIQIEKAGYSFDLISIELSGEAIAPLDIIGHETTT